jgi:hypothetical protein
METKIVSVENNFFDYFFSAQGNYLPPKQDTQPKSFLKTDDTGLLYTTEDCSISEKDTLFSVNIKESGKNTLQNMKLSDILNFIKSKGDASNGFNIILKNLIRFVRFDEVNIPSEKRIYSPSKINTISYNINSSIGISFNIKGCFVTQITDWDKNWTFISYFNTRDFGSKIASKTEILSLKGEYDSPCFYMSDSRSELYLGTLQNGNIIPSVIQDNVSSNLPNAFFITCKKGAKLTEIIDTRLYNSNYGPVLDYITALNTGTYNIRNIPVSSKYVFVRVPSLFIIKMRYNFPTKQDGTFNPIPLSNADILNSGYSIASLDEFTKDLTGNSKVLNYNTPLSSYNIVLADNGFAKQYSLSGTVLKENDDRSQYFLWIIKLDNPLNNSLQPGDVLDFEKCFGEIQSTSEHPKNTKIWRILGYTLLTIFLVILFIFIYLKYKVKNN